MNEPLGPEPAAWRDGHDEARVRMHLSQLDNLSRLDTTAIPVDLDYGTNSNASEAYVAQWDQLLVGLRTDFQVQPINELYADTGDGAHLNLPTSAH